MEPLELIIVVIATGLVVIVYLGQHKLPNEIRLFKIIVEYKNKLKKKFQKSKGEDKLTPLSLPSQQDNLQLSTDKPLRKKIRYSVSSKSYTHERYDYSVFISHAEQDRQIVKEIFRILERNAISCCIPSRNSPEDINRSRIVIIVYSQQSNKSREMLEEIKYAINKGKIILPVVIDDDVRLSREMQNIRSTYPLFLPTYPVQKLFNILPEIMK